MKARDKFFALKKSLNFELLSSKSWILIKNRIAVPFLSRNDSKTKSGLDKDSKKIFKFHWGKKSSINSRKNIPLGLIPTSDFYHRRRASAGLNGRKSGPFVDR